MRHQRQHCPGPSPRQAFARWSVGRRLHLSRGLPAAEGEAADTAISLASSARQTPAGMVAIASANLSSGPSAAPSDSRLLSKERGRLVRRERRPSGVRFRADVCEKKRSRSEFSERIHRRVRHDKVPPEKRRSKQMAIWHATSTSDAARQSIGTKYSDIRPLDANRDDLSPRSGTFNSLQIQQPVMAQQAGPSRSGCAGRMRRPMLKSVLAGQVRKDRRKSPQSHPS